jgi:signal transduction histidine kinase
MQTIITTSSRWRGVTLQLFLFVFLPLTAVTLIVALAGAALHENAMREMVGERDERAARAAANGVSAQLTRRAMGARALAVHAAVSPETAVTDYAFLLSDFDGGLALFAADGEPIAATADWRHWPLAALFADGRLNGAAFSPLFTDPASGEKMMLAAASNELGMTAVGAFSATALARQALVGAASGHHPVTAFVVDAAGQIVYLAGHEHSGNADPLTHPGVSEALRGESGATYLTLDGRERVVAFSPVPPVGWGLIIEEEWRNVANPTLRATQLAPLALIPALLLGLLALWFGARQIVRPLQALEQKATELGWGDFAAIEEPVGGISEIGRLQTELIQMARKVKTAQQSLRSYVGAVTAGQEEERRRLARELHDETIQSLIALNQRLQLAQRALADHPHSGKLAELQRMTAQAIADARRFARALRPIYLEDLGLSPALEMLARDAARDAGEAAGQPISWRLSGQPRRLKPEVELTLYRMAQEALSNALRHAEASQISLSLDFAPGRVTLTVEDDGRGFTLPETSTAMAPLGHFGLLGLYERAELIGAELEIESAPGKGTRAQVSVSAS